MKKVKGKDEENFKHPKNDILILQWANTALGNRLDHYKRIIEQKKQSERSFQAICECYEFFFTSYFAGWQNFLTKLERLNLLVKKQDNNERQTSKFKQLFESMGEMVQVMNKLKECMEKATKDAQQPIVMNAGNNQNANNNAVNKQRIQTNAAALSDLQKITKTRIESFLEFFKSIYTEVAIDCATYGQRMNDAVKSLAQNNDANDTMRRLYRENSQLQSKIKEQENYLSKFVPLAETEKDFIVNYFGNQNKMYEEIQQRLNEEKELTERLSLRIRQKIDYCVNSITTKTGQPPDPSQILAKYLQNQQQISGTGKDSLASTISSLQNNNLQGNNMEIEDAATEEKEGFECICGGYQAEYFCQKYEETLKKLIETQQELRATQTIMSQSTGNVGIVNGLTNIGVANAASSLLQATSSAPQSNATDGVKQENSQTLPILQQSISLDTSLNENKNNSNIIENQNSTTNSNNLTNTQQPLLKKNESIQIQQPHLIQTSNIQGEEMYDSKLRVSFAEKVLNLQKQNEHLTSQKQQLEQFIREMELEQKNQEEKFFRSGAYQSLAVQTEELLKTSFQLRNQLKETKQQINDIEKLRYREMQETILKFKEEKETLMRQVQEVREGVYKTQLGEIMRENLSQHFNYKKYTQPLQEQLEKTSESLTLSHEHCQNLEEQKTQITTQLQTLQKTISELQIKMSEKEQYILLLESKVDTTGQSYAEEKTFKYPKHKETLKYIEKLLVDLQSSGQVNNEASKNFKEVITYIKSREEKVKMVEATLKKSETENKKLQQNIDQIWKDYESLEISFKTQKQLSDQRMQELKNHAEREQELECKNLEIQMQFQKEKQAYTIMISAEQQKKDTAKQFIEGLEEQNKQILAQNQHLSILLEENMQLNQQTHKDLEETNIQLLEIKQRYDLVNKKYNDTTQAYNELIAKYEVSQVQLSDAYDVLESNEQKNSNVEVKQLKEKLQNMRLLLQCSCGENIKDTILQKCLHPFCRSCIDKQIRLRQRTCPKCRTAFGANDVKNLYLSH